MPAATDQRTGRPEVRRDERLDDPGDDKHEDRPGEQPEGVARRGAEGVAARQPARREERPAEPQPGPRRDADRRQFQHAVRQDEGVEADEVAAVPDQPGQRPEHPPVVDQEEHPEYAAGGTESEPEDRDLDVVPDDLGRDQRALRHVEREVAAVLALLLLQAQVLVLDDALVEQRVGELGVPHDRQPRTRGS